MRAKTIPTNGRRSTYGGFGAGPLPDRNKKLPTSTLSSDEIDKRLKLVLEEVERCKTFDGKYIESSVLHGGGVPQTFVPSELSMELEAELDRLLTEQILREEHAASNTPPNFVLGVVDDAAEASVANMGPEVCLACNGPCTWTPFCDADALSRRKKELYREMKSCEKQTTRTVTSMVARSTLNGGETKFVQKELLKELA